MSTFITIRCKKKSSLLEVFFNFKKTAFKFYTNKQHFWMAVFEACLVFNVRTHQIKTLSNVNADSKSFYIVLYFPNDWFLIFFLHRLL